jgi:hypothetical protein
MQFSEAENYFVKYYKGIRETTTHANHAVVKQTSLRGAASESKLATSRDCNANYSVGEICLK